ncbi:uncharacterized protein JCM15063_004062 [Sporobolomyces koalae]|uniref:uncharacterized protein n=1 Tax=Sporobolomyces koalae TaxID=500713 RepID=UPI00317F1DF8
MSFSDHSDSDSDHGPPYKPFQAASRHTYLSSGHGARRTPSPNALARRMEGLTVQQQPHTQQPRTPEQSHHHGHHTRAHRPPSNALASHMGALALDPPPPRTPPPRTPPPRTSPPRTPAQPHLHDRVTRSQANPEAPGAPTHTSQHHFWSQPEIPASLEPHQVLLTELMRCQPVKEYRTTMNKVAKDEHYDKIPFKLATEEIHALASYGSRDAVTFREAFLAALIPKVKDSQQDSIVKWGKLVPVAQMHRPAITNEANVADLVLSNVLNPICELLNNFLDLKNHPHLHITVESQFGVLNSKLDHVIFLTAPGILKEKHWDLHYRRNLPEHIPNEAVKTLLPQLFLYAHRMQCSRLFLTDYNHTIGIRPNLQQLKAATVDVGAEVILNGQRHPNIPDP